MSFLVILLVATVGAAIVRPRAGTRAWARYAMGVAFVVAGASHLARPGPFEQHLPGWVPAATAIIVVTGLIEIVLGVAFVARTNSRELVGKAIAAYLVAVWPANIYVAVADVEVDGLPGGVQAWLRIPMQVVFIGWAWWSALPTATPAEPIEPAGVVAADRIPAER